MNYYEHLKSEFNYLKKKIKDKDILEVFENFYPVFEKAVEIWDEQGHSGFSAHYFAPIIAETLKNIFLFRPIVPIDDEKEFGDWIEITDNIYQSSRVPSIFKENGKIMFLNALIFIDERGRAFTGTIKTELGFLSSKQEVKFPFRHKSFYVEVLEIENDFYEITDKNKLVEAKNYYKIKFIK